VKNRTSPNQTGPTPTYHDKFCPSPGMTDRFDVCICGALKKARQEERILLHDRLGGKLSRAFLSVVDQEFSGEQE
jgi:hypothetical protein